METEIRLNKFLSEAGICSRREADRLIDCGAVTVDGTIAVPGQKVSAGNQVAVNGKVVGKRPEKIYLLFNKPRGIVCTAQKREPHNLADYLNYPVRVTYAGRLDKDSEGLLLLTNDGDLIDQMMRARNHHEKEYMVTVDRPVTETFLHAMASGVPILDTMTRPCRVEKVSERTFRIVLTQGLNRQIRRMCEYFQYRVLQLRRVRIMNLRLGDLKTGQYRLLTETEQAELFRRLKLPGARK